MTGIAAAFVWAGGLGHLVVTVPAGAHINAAAPASLGVNEAAVSGAGDLSGWKVPITPLSSDPSQMVVVAEVPICADNGTCTLVQLVGSGPAGKRGKIDLHEPARPAAAGATAAPNNVATVYDFRAVWCPPCNLLAAEVLDTEAGTQALHGSMLTPVDADLPESWALKTRYHVGGYPTMVAVDAEGIEVARLVGYPGPEETLGWLAGLSSRPSLDAQIAAATGTTAAKLARELAEAGDDRARTVLGRTTEDDEDTRVTRLLLDGKAEDAAWLFDHGTDGGDWVYAALDADPKLAGRVPALVPGADGEAAAGWLAAAADQLGPGREADAMHAGALAALEAARSGELELDRGRLTDLAELRAELGNLGSAYALLDEAAARWPDEFTWPFAKARIALGGKDLPTAEGAARKALANAAGDQILRAAMSLARVLRAEGRLPEAIVTLNAALLAVPAPPADMQVRTTRYRTEVQKLLAELGAGAVSQGR